MISIQPVPSKELRAQLVGLGLIPALHDVTPMPPILAQKIQEAAANGPSTGNGSGTGTPLAPPPPGEAPDTGTNWLLWGGVAAGAVFLGILFLRR
jgi:LPXTG-motif cell wall-anchored protein